MKLILFLLIPFIVFSQTTFYDTVYFNIPEGDPLVQFDNRSFVQWFDNLPQEWREDLVDQNFAEKRKIGRDNYYVLSLKSKIWLNGNVLFDIVPDSAPLFNYGKEVIAYQDSGVKDLTVVDFDSVEIAEYFWKIPRVVTPIGALIVGIESLFSESIEQDIISKKKIKKVGKRLRYPNQPHFASLNNRKNRLKRWINFKFQRKGKPKPYNVAGGIVLPNDRGHLDGPGGGIVP